MNDWTKNILRASIKVYLDSKDKPKFLEHIKAQTEKYSKDPFVKARGTATQN